MKDENIDTKQQVHDFWNEASCGTSVTAKEKYSREYFEEIENYRYETEPDIFEFAQFTRFHGKKVLEVGVGAGTDFLQWVRAGADAYGIDITEEGVKNVKERLKIYGLTCSELKVADAEDLPFPDNCFDLVYSWGVIHHTPDTIKALREIIRVTKQGGMCKIMLYNKYSLQSITMYIRYGLFAGRPFRTLSDIYYHHQESIATKVFSKQEILQILHEMPVQHIKIYRYVKPRDVWYQHKHFVRKKMSAKDLAKAMYSLVLRALACLMGYFDAGFYLKCEFTKR